jgi:hypothetical protein
MDPGELMRDNQFMADFYRAAAKEITAAELRAKHGVTADDLRSVVKTIRAERDRRTAANGVSAGGPVDSSDNPNTINEHAERSSKGARKKSDIPTKRVTTKADTNLPAPSFADDSELVEDLARYAENVLSEKEVRKRHRLTEKDWIAMAEDDELVRKIDDRRIRRVRDGSCKRELAQLHVVRGPAVLANIMDDPSAHAKHKVDAIKTLDHLATPPGDRAAADASRFVISIDLTADGGNTIEHYSKPYKVGVEDDTDNIDTATLAIIAAKQNRNDGGGQNHI